MLECIKHWIKTGLDQPIEGEEEEELTEPLPEELAQADVDWDELTTENLAEHIRLLGENEDMGEVSHEELFAMGLIPLQGVEHDTFDSENEAVSEADGDSILAHLSH
jgi:hypothetical protein